jgi:hypothetical protein
MLARTPRFPAIAFASLALGASSSPPTVTATSFKPPSGGSIQALAADGARAALIVGFDRGCASVQVWEPAQRRAIELQHPCGPHSDVSRIEDTTGVALAGNRAGWLHESGGNELEAGVMTATLARRTPVFLADVVSNADDHHGDTARGPYGHGNLIVFTIDHRCDADGALNGRPEDQCPAGAATGDIVASAIWRAGGTMHCPGVSSSRCTRVLKAGAERTVLAVDGSRIVVRAEDGVMIVNVQGKLIREFPIDADAAALSGSRVALSTITGIEIYGIGSGAKTGHFPPSILEDLDGDILVTAAGSRVTLRNLASGRTTAIRAAHSIVSAQLERSGLFVATTQLATFTRMQDVIRRLGG